MQKRFLWFTLVMTVLSVIIVIPKLKQPFGDIFYFGLNLLSLSIISLIIIATMRIWQSQNGIRFTAILTALICLAIISLHIILLTDYRLLIPGSRITELTKTEWIDDVNFLKDELAKHPATDSIMTDRLQNLMEEFNRDLEKNNVNRNMVNLMKMIACYDDGHSFMHPFQFHANSRFFPLTGYYFKEGYFIVNASSEYESTKFAELIAINQMPFDSIFSKITSAIGADNQFQLKSMLDIYLFSVNVLNGLGIIDSVDEAVFQFKDQEGRFFSVELESEPFFTWMFWAFKPIEHFSPVYFGRRNLNYSLLDKGNDLILDLNMIEHQSDDYTIKDLSVEIERRLNERNIQRLIIDLRTNGGGNNFLYRPLIDVIKNNAKINRKDRLYLLISRRTFSAAINLVDDLMAQTAIMLVGESPGAGATHYGDARYINLPNSTFGLMISTKQWLAKDSLNIGNEIKPDIVIDYSIKHFTKGIDPWLKSIEDKMGL